MRPDASFIRVEGIATGSESKEGLLRIQVNGESREVPVELSLQELLIQLAVPGDRVAIELNQKVVRRAGWTEVKLREDDRIEIVHFVGGGCGREVGAGGRRQEAGGRGRRQGQEAGGRRQGQEAGAGGRRQEAGDLAQIEDVSLST
jgi:sulfur carrier protein